MTSAEIKAKLDRAIRNNLDHSIDDLSRLCAVPSISAEDRKISEGAQAVADLLEAHGFQAQILPTDGNPVVFGEGRGRQNKTILFYLHYDVQPPEPLELWRTPPFELSRENDRLYARGVVDDKGHIVARLAALTALRNSMGELPCHVKFVIEGEEELGSPNIAGFIEKHRSLLSADACVWEFGGVNHLGSPTQVLGMRGICYVELAVRTALHDAHSGLGGSIFPNAAWRLVWALNSLKDQDERIKIPGFYDNVLPPSANDLKLLAKLPDDTLNLQEMYGLKGFLNGMTGGVEFNRTAIFEPTCTVCGLTSDYQGTSSKTVLPAEARAKVDFRLVPNQTAEEVLKKLRTHLDREGFDDVEIILHGSTRPARIDPEHRFVKLTAETAREVYGREIVTSPMSGGSGPIYPFVYGLNLPVVSAGIGYPGFGAPAPNEPIRIDDFIQGIRHTAYIVEAFSRLDL